ncbi:MAG TPA: prepilin-type N-terminal cleavage/methylation domain-containing protein [Gemmatimonadales bacterium]|nr:prepilin-type N-terminal cleavage/methylation domain-containing protein [Gemmatimonadales bacterium]
MARGKQRGGFTLVEVVVAILVLAIGLLGLAGAAVLVSRMIAKGQRSAAQAAFAGRRLEMLRTTGCSAQDPGTDVLFHGSTPIDSIRWRFVDGGNGAWQLVVRSKYRADGSRWRSDSIQTAISCNR